LTTRDEPRSRVHAGNDDHKVLQGDKEVYSDKSSTYRSTVLLRVEVLQILVNITSSILLVSLTEAGAVAPSKEFRVCETQSVSDVMFLPENCPVSLCRILGLMTFLCIDTFFCTGVLNKVLLKSGKLHNICGENQAVHASSRRASRCHQ
jgi:hypothetical protein